MHTATVIDDTLHISIDERRPIEVETIREWVFVQTAQRRSGSPRVVKDYVFSPDSVVIPGA